MRSLVSPLGLSPSKNISETVGFDGGLPEGSPQCQVAHEKDSALFPLQVESCVSTLVTPDIGSPIIDS